VGWQPASAGCAEGLEEIMARLEGLDDGQLALRLSWPERLLALRGEALVSLANVRSVEVTDDLVGAVRGLRAPGTGIPGLVAVGTFRGRGWRDLVIAAGRGPGVVVTLAPEANWRRLLVRDRDARATASRLQAAIAPN
jgi:hypothetical protein